jgi:hypothetical protein
MLLTMTGRLIIMLVVMTAMVATKQLAVASPAPTSPEPRANRASWIDRLQVGLSKSISRSALLQRIAFAQPRAPLSHRDELTTHPVRQELPSPYRFCLPPPIG